MGSNKLWLYNVYQWDDMMVGETQDDEFTAMEREDPVTCERCGKEVSFAYCGKWEAYWCPDCVVVANLDGLRNSCQVKVWIEKIGEEYQVFLRWLDGHFNTIGVVNDPIPVCKTTGTYLALDDPEIRRISREAWKVIDDITQKAARDGFPLSVCTFVFNTGGEDE